MRQFDVFENPSTRSRGARPFVLILQNDRWQAAASVIVAPLASPEKVPASGFAFPKLSVNGEAHTLVPHEIAAIAKSQLVGRAIANLEADRYAIITALDQLF
jgi:mRNA-degrading endonuclease toxin of MazEF toxin-antitoxin module